MGVPVRLPNGSTVGTLCILDHKSSDLLRPEDLEFLSMCATRIAAELSREDMIDDRVQRAQLMRAEQEDALRMTGDALRRIMASSRALTTDMSIAQVCDALARELDGFGGIRIGRISVQKNRTRYVNSHPLHLPGGHYGAIQLMPGDLTPAMQVVYLPALINHVSLLVGQYLLQTSLATSAETLAQTEQKLLAQEKLAITGTMAASIAHDIRNIIAAMSFDLESSRPTSDAWNRIKVQIERFQVLNHRLLVYAQPNRFAKEKINLAVTAETCVSLLDAWATAHGVTLHLSANEETYITGDEPILEHMLVNLVLNAVEAMTPRGGNVNIEVLNDGTDAVILVRDDGPGIPSSIQDTLFEPFVTSRRNGFGLGLYSCRRIAKDHNGELSLKATSSSGTEFEVRIPKK
jgi:signal transduction histidine kinase